MQSPWRYTRVDAFTNRPFAGNPAAVIWLQAWPADSLLANVAAELNLSETAFVVDAKRQDGALDLRWFTPAVEVDLCGHATLAAGVVVLRDRASQRGERGERGERVHFATRSGTLAVSRRGDRYCIDLPARPPHPISDPALLKLAQEAINARVVAIARADKLLLELEDGTAVANLRPDLARIAALNHDGVIVTAGRDRDRDQSLAQGIPADVDFVSRFFTPNHGIAEDPVTGSAHCVLTPYWLPRIGRPTLRARQLSHRSGDLECELIGDRVSLTGHAVIVGHGVLSVN